MKKGTRIGALLVLSTGVLALSACGNKGGNNDKPAKDLKVGLITLHSHDESTYDKNFYDSMMAAQKKLGFDLVVRLADEDESCYNTAKALADDGCDIIMADSFGHEDYMIQAAREYPDVQFCHATGTQAAGVKLANFHDAFAAIYEGRYLAGVVAGQKMAEDIAAGKYTAEQAKIGYVGAHPYAEVVSGYTSFFLGARSVVPTVTMDVTYTNSWYDYSAEEAAATSLINSGAKLISQHADSYGAPKACETKGVPNVAYNGATDDEAPNTYLVSSKIDWAPYFEHIVNCVLEDKAIETDFVGTLADGSVKLTKFGKNVSAEAKSKVAAAEAALKAGTLHVFDCSKFTVGGAAPTEENVKPGPFTYTDYPAGTEFLKDGYYHESEYRSAPSFDVRIDGITELA
ncbi:MAG: BMP family ABC transporter substrate-binding protein [Bacilli bacterium]|nr:BMP family ABC transporter substrate-binding protein [Bacilli bacterium]